MIRICCFITLLVLILMVNEQQASEQFKIAIVHSFSMKEMSDNNEFKNETDFIKSKKDNVLIQTFYLNYTRKVPENILHANAFRVYERILNFNPNLIIVYNNIAFEHIGMQYVYPKPFMIYGVGKSLVSNYILDVPSVDKTKISGVYHTIDVERINNIYSRTESQSFYVVKNNGRYFELFLMDFISRLKPNKIETFNVEDLNGLKKTISLINEKPVGILLLMFDGIVDSEHNIMATDLDITNAITQRNTKHFEICLTKDLAVMGLCASNVVNYKSKTPYSYTAFEIILGKKLADPLFNVLLEDRRAMEFNQARIKKLKYDYLLNEHLYEIVYQK